MEERTSPTRWSSSDDLPEDAAISFYKQGDFTDLCAGPHLPSAPAKCKAFKLMSVAGRVLARQRKEQDAPAHLRHGFRPAKKTWTPISRAWKRPKSATTASWAASWICSTSMDEGPGLPLLLAQGHDPAQHADGLLARDPHARRAMQEINTPIILNRALWERSPATGTITRKICTPR